MAKNIQQVYVANPTTSPSVTDLVYLGKSPYGASNNSAILAGALFTNSFDVSFESIVSNTDVEATSYSARNTTNQLILGATNTTTISASAPASSSIYTIPDVGTTANFVLSAGTQTVGGAKTFSSAVTINPASNQLVLGVTNTATISASAPSASRVYTIADAGADASFVMTAGSQTVGGGKTFSSAIGITAASNQLVFGSGTTATISVVAPSGSRLYQLIDAGASCNFVMSAGDQSIGGFKAFSQLLQLSASTNQLTLGSQTTITSPNPSGARTYTIPDAGASASFVMTAGTQTIGGAATFSNGLTINPTTNQLILGVTNTTTITSVAPSAARIYTIPDAGVDTSFVLGTSALTTIAQSASSSGATVTHSITNSSNTASSDALLKIAVGGTSGNDPYALYNIPSGTSWVQGADNSDSDAFVLSVGTALGTSNAMRVDSTGRFTYPTQPVFIAYKSANSTNQTGDGTNLTIVFDTEINDIGSNYDNTTGIFTAPVTGIYLAQASVQYKVLGAGHTQGLVKFVFTGNDKLFYESNVGAERDNGNTLIVPTTSRQFSMVAGDTMKVDTLVANSTKTVTIGGDSFQSTFFSMRLLG